MEKSIDKKVTSLLRNRAFAVIRLDDENKALPLVEALVNGGVKNIEITLTSKNPYRMLEKVSKEFAETALVGVGSVLNKEMLENSINSGASYVVTPILKPELIGITHDNNLPIFTGAFSPTEIYKATELGADVVKVFPANIVGMEYFKAILAPMPNLKIMPTGGVSLTNAAEWFSVGACAVGVGGALLNKNDIADGNFLQITEKAKILMSGINNYFDEKEEKKL